MEKLKTIDLKGKPYVTVAERVRYFRENVKDANIVTTPTFIEGTTGKYIQFRADIYIGKELVSNAHSMKALNLPYAYEKTETAAIGRALGLYGIGIECGVASYEEVREAIRTEIQDEIYVTENYDKATEAQKKEMTRLLNIVEKTSTSKVDYQRIQFEALSYSGASSIGSATKAQATKLIDYLKNNS